MRRSRCQLGWMVDVPNAGEVSEVGWANLITGLHDAHCGKALLD